MALHFKDNCGETTNTTGTDDLVLTGTPLAKRQVLGAADDGKTVSYWVEDGSGTGWEKGRGVYTHSSKTVARTTIDDSSDGGSKITLSGTTPHNVGLMVGAGWFNDMEKYHDVMPGTAFPTAPNDGMMFYHQTRKILYVYEQAWVPVELCGSITIYVDKTGTDGDAFGFAPSGDAFLTVQYAVDSLPPTRIGTATVTILVNTGTYTEEVVFNGNYTITIQGATTEEVTSTFSAVGVNSFTDSSETWGSTDLHKHNFVEVTSGTYSGTWGAIASSTTSEVAWLGHTEPNGGYWTQQYSSGTAGQPSASDSYKIHSLDVIIQGILPTSQKGLVLDRLKIGTGSPTDQPVIGQGYCDIEVRMCHIDDSGTNSAVRIKQSKFFARSSIFTGGTQNTLHLDACYYDIRACLFDNEDEGTNISQGSAVDIIGNSSGFFLSNYVIGSSVADCDSVVASGNATIGMGWNAATGSYITGAPVGAYDGIATKGGGISGASNANTTWVRGYTTSIEGWTT